MKAIPKAPPVSARALSAISWAMMATPKVVMAR
jgi:hypothetical protein